MPGDSQARMIQMLAALSDIQLKKRAQTLDEQKFEESKGQFAAQMGFNEKSAEYKKITELANAIAEQTTNARGATVELADMIFPGNQRMHDVFTHLAQTAPESLNALRTSAANEGVHNMAPQARAQLNTEAANVAATGMNQGAMGTSAMQNVLAGGGDPTAAFGKDMLRNMAGGFLQKQATGQTSDQAAMSEYITSHPGLVAQGAGIQQGNMTPYQSAMLPIQQQQADAQTGQVQADVYRTNEALIRDSQEMTLKLASAKALGGLTPENRIQAISQQRELLTAFGKEKSSSVRDNLLAKYNELNKLLGRDPLTAGQLPQEAGYLDRMIGTFSPPGMPAPQPTAPPSTNPMSPFFPQTSPMFNTPAPQLLQPGIRP